MELSGRSGWSTCGKIEKSTISSASSLPEGGFQHMASSPMLGAITMLPPLTPTHTARSDGRRSASPDCRIQWHRYRESPPPASRASVSWTRGTQNSSSMLGSAVSSSTPKDFQPSSHNGVPARPVMNRLAAAGPPIGCPYDAVGMQRALDSAIGLPSRPVSASWMLVFLIPADVRRSFTVALPSLYRRPASMAHLLTRLELGVAVRARSPIAGRRSGLLLLIALAARADEVPAGRDYAGALRPAARAVWLVPA